MDNLPTWARIVAMVGLPSAIVLGLIIVIIMLAPSLVDTLNIVPAMRDELRSHSRQSTDETREVTRLLRQICRNVAKSEISSTGCEAR